MNRRMQMSIKMMIAVIGVALCLSGCKYSPKDEHGKYVAESTEDGFVLEIRGIHQRFQYVMIDGHEYLVMNLDAKYSSGITHSPRCQCLNWRRDD